MKKWTIVVTDLQGQVYGRPKTYDRHFTFPLKSGATAAFRVRLDDPWAGALLKGDVFVRVYYGADLLFHGLVTSYERILDGQGNRSVAVTASDPWFRLAKRVINRTTNIATVSGDRGALVADQINYLNSVVNTGVLVDPSIAYLSGTTADYGIAPYQNFSEMVTELATGASGFEWRVMPIEYQDGKIGVWYAEAVAGRHFEDAVLFEYGTGKRNIAEARETGDLTGVVTTAYHIADAGPGAPGNPVVSQVNAAAENTRGRYEEVISASLTDTTLRQNLVDEHVIVRGGFRRVISFTPAKGSRPRVPEFWTDYDVGDFVKARAVDETGLWLDASVRIWQAEVQPDDNGVDTLILRLVEEG